MSESGGKPNVGFSTAEIQVAITLLVEDSQ
jgi:hypothetical protein